MMYLMTKTEKWQLGNRAPVFGIAVQAVSRPSKQNVQNSHYMPSTMLDAMSQKKTQTKFLPIFLGGDETYP